MQLIAKNTIISGLETAASLLISLSTYYLMVSNFGLEALGLYAFLSIFTLLGAINLLDLGIEAYVINQVGKRQLVQWKTIAGVFFISVIACSFLTSLLLGSYVERISDSFLTFYERSSLFILISLPLQYCNIYMGAIFQGLERFGIFKVNNLLINILTLVIVGFCFFTNNFLHLSLVFILGPALRLLHYSLFLPKLMPLGGENFLTSDLGSFFDAHKLIYKCRYLFLARITGFFFNQTDKLIISYFLSISDLGIYDLAKKLSSPIQALSSTLLSALMPRISTMSLQDGVIASAKWINYYAAAVTGASGLFLIVAFIIINLSQPVGFDSGAQVFLIFVSMAIVSSRASYLSTVALPLGFTKAASSIGFLSLLVNTSLSLIFVNLYGVTGVAFATFISLAISSLCFAYTMRGIHFELSSLPTKEIIAVVVIMGIFKVTGSSPFIAVILTLMAFLILIDSGKTTFKMIREFK